MASVGGPSSVAWDATAIVVSAGDEDSLGNSLDQRQAKHSLGTAAAMVVCMGAQAPVVIQHTPGAVAIVGVQGCWTTVGIDCANDRSGC